MGGAGDISDIDGTPDALCDITNAYRMEAERGAKEKKPFIYTDNRLPDFTTANVGRFCLIRANKWAQKRPAPRPPSGELPKR